MASPTLKEYADELVRLVALDRTEHPNVYRAVRNWTDLHGVCDANEYLIEADENLGADWDGSDESNRFRNDAIELAERDLFPKRTILVHLNVTLHGNPDLGADEIADVILSAVEIASDDEHNLGGRILGRLFPGDLASDNDAPITVALAEEV